MAAFGIRAIEDWLVHKRIEMSAPQLGDAPDGSVTPPFPGLGIPDSALLTIHDAWYFTLIWTVIVYEAFHLAASAYALFVQRNNLNFVWIVPVVFAAVAGIEALLAGSVVGLILGAMYQAGDFRMSTWVPFVWAWINLLVLILSSFSIKGGL